MNVAAVTPSHGSTEVCSRRKYATYCDTRQSHVRWIGAIPAHWEVKPLNRDGPILRGSSPRPIDAPEYFDDEGEYAWVRIEDVSASPDGYLRMTTQRLSPLGASYSRKLEPGQLFLSMAASVGKPCITAIRCCIHDGFVYFPHLRLKIRFAYYVFLSGELFRGEGKLGTQLNLNTQIIGSLRIPIPPPDEQRAIAAFLDRETARIDALIAKKQRLIELLQEKRTALISHAVTKGLDPNAPMKPSGIDWLGTIPPTWQAKRLKYAFFFLNNRRVPLSALERADMERTYPYYGASGIIDHVDSYLFDEPLILVAEDGANLYSRSTPLAFVATGKYWVNNHAHILKPRYGSLTFWEALLQAVQYDPWISGSAQPKLTKENLGSIPLPIPPEDEIAAIADFIVRANEQLSPLVAATSNAVDRLREYRSALISAAVTGKIDVRGWEDQLQ